MNKAEEQLYETLNDIMPICSCVDFDVVAQAYIEILEWASSDWEKERKERYNLLTKNDALFYLTATPLNNKQLLEHGGNIWGSWATEEGKEMLVKLKQLLKDYKEEQEKE